MTWFAMTHARRDIHIELPKLPTKQRPRWDGRGRHIYTPAATEAAELMIHAAWVDAHGLEWSEWRGPVEVRIVVSREVAQRATRREQGKLVCQKPDLDNTAKLVLDALNGTAWHDDEQVVQLHVIRKPRQPKGSKASIYIQVTYIDDREVVG